MAARGGEGEGWSLFSKLLISGLPDVVVSEIWASFSREQVVQWVRGKRGILDSISAGAVSTSSVHKKYTGLRVVHFLQVFSARHQIFTLGPPNERGS